MNNFSVKIKRNWFDKNSKISKVGTEAFSLYIILWLFKTQIQDTVITSIQMLYQYTNGIPKGKIVEYLRVLKTNKMIDYDSNKYRFANNYDLAIPISLIDLPNLIRKDNKDNPATDEDIFLSFKSSEIDYILSKGLSHRHVVLYLTLRCYNKDVYPSDDTLAQCTGLGKNQISSKYLSELESIYIIANEKRQISKKKKGNFFYICNDINDIDKFYKQNEEIFIRNQAEKIKKELAKRKIGTTVREVEKFEHKIKNICKEQQDMYYAEKEKHTVFAIKYFYDNIHPYLTEENNKQEFLEHLYGKDNIISHLNSETTNAIEHKSTYEEYKSILNKDTTEGLYDLDELIGAKKVQIEMKSDDCNQALEIQNDMNIIKYYLDKFEEHITQESKDILEIKSKEGLSAFREFFWSSIYSVLPDDNVIPIEPKNNKKYIMDLSEKLFG